MARHRPAGYDDFAVRIEADDQGGFWVRVLSPQGVGGKVRFEPEGLGREPLAAMLRRLGHRVRATGGDAAADHRNLTPIAAPAGATEVDPGHVGQALFQAIFRDRVRDALNTCWATSIGQGRRGVRIRLVFDRRDPGIGQIASLPWELLLAPGERTPWSRRGDMPVVRFFETGRPPRVPRLEAPVRVLIASANPSNLPHLDLATEVDQVGRALAQVAGARVERLADCRYETLQKRLRDRRRPIHVLHFLGHGRAGLGNWPPAILLAGEDGGEEALSGELLAEMLTGAPLLRLVVLNACETATIPTAEGADPMVGIAAALAGAGVPGVVAMQFPISDAASIRFSRAFYAALAHGEPVDVAVAAGRQEIVRHDPATLEWATPALYLSVGENAVLDLRPSLRRQRLALLRNAGLGLAVASLLFAITLLSRRDQGGPAPYQRPTVAPVAECPPPAGLEDMVFVRIDGGSVDGGAEGDSESPSSAGAQVIAPFCLAAFETTQGQLEAVLGEEADHSRFRGVDLPTERVTWDEPREFVRRLNERAGAEVFRLPTSAEWEHAARAGTTTAYSFGDDPAELHRYGNCLSGEGPDDGFDNRTAPVGSFEPNPWGLYEHPRQRVGMGHRSG
jgi:hypothetical protein